MIKPLDNKLEGNLLSAVRVSTNKAVGITTLNQIYNFGLQRPTVIDKRPRKDADPKIQKAHEIHEATQRNFDKARKDRAVDYAAYIKAVEVDDAMGGTPAITLFFEDELRETEDGLFMSYGANFTAIDGETQLEARFILQDAIPETGAYPIAITIYHGIKVEHAKQILHDLNHYVTPVSEMKASTFNRNGAISRAVVEAQAVSTIGSEHINIKGIEANKKTKMAHAQIMFFVAGCQLGKEGLVRSVSASILSKLNSPLANDVGQVCIQSTSKVIVQAMTNPVLGKSNKSLWQIAGALCSTGVDVMNLNWGKANEAYTQTKQAGRGGARMPMAQKLKAIEIAFLS